MKKVALAFLGLAFAFAISSDTEKEKKQEIPKKNIERVMKHHDKW